MDCIFCKKHGEKERDEAKGFKDIHPATEGHFLIMPKRHVERFEELSDKEIIDIKSIIKELALKITDYNIVTSIGKKAGQEINHVHIHFIPRYDDDKVQIKW